MNEHANRVNGIVRLDFTFMDLTKTILNFDFTFENEDKETFSATQTVNIVNDMIGFEFLVKASAQYYYKFILAGKMVLKHEGVLTLVETWNGDDGGPKTLAIFYLHDAG